MFQNYSRNLFKHPELLEPATSGVSRVLFRYKQADLRTPPDAAGFVRWEREAMRRQELALLKSNRRPTRARRLPVPPDARKG